MRFASTNSARHHRPFRHLTRSLLIPVLILALAIATMFQSSKKKLTKSNAAIQAANAAAAASSSATTSNALSSSSLSSSSSSSSPSLLPHILTDGKPLPKLIVFDLDYTLWPFWVDTHVVPPLKVNPAHTTATDRIGEDFSFYRDVPSILWSLSQAGVRLGVASRTHAPDLGREMLKLLHVGPPTDENGLSLSAPPLHSSSKKDTAKQHKPRKAIDMFDQLEIYPSSKIKHFEAMARRTGIPFADMLFFDDESRNREVRGLGVTFWLVRDGTDWEEVEKGILQWRRDNQKS